MSRREIKRPRQTDTPQANQGKKGLLTGMMAGLAIGIALSAGVAWYINFKTPSPPPLAQTPKTSTQKTDAIPVSEETRTTSAPPSTQATNVNPERVVGTASPATAPRNQSAQPKPAPPPSAPQTEAPTVNYTFYGILPGDKPARPIAPPPSKDTWWLQIAALSDPQKADQIKAKLILLNLRASTQKTESSGHALYRIRVGPYTREDDAFGDLDILTENNFNARLFKDPKKP